MIKRNQYQFSGLEKIIKGRMKAVGNIAKITKAMKMVASSKRRLDLLRLENGKDFGVHMLPKVFENDTYLKARTVDQQANKILAIPVTTDRGLCGGINSNLLRQMREIIVKNRDKYNIICIGDKGSAALTRPFPDIFKTAITDINTPLNFYNVASIAQFVLAQDIEWDQISIFYNHYVNTISSKVKELKIMNKKQFKKQLGRVTQYDISQPDVVFATDHFYEIYVASQFYHALLQNAACEQSARMNAMENASKNATEILEKLTLKYNKARQARITMELVEIISGASAL